jgi:ABC-type multidrug transport system fused ATPase/permease subunit
MVALLRIAPLMKGVVYLDGVDIATVPLQKLRSVIAIIPQVRQRSSDRADDGMFQYEIK